MPPLPPTRRLAAAGVLLLAAALGLGVALTRLGGRATGELSLDRALADHRSPLPTAIARGVDVALDTPGALLALLVVCTAVAVRDRAAALLLGMTTAAGWLAVTAAKGVVGRPRPPAAEVDALVHKVGSTSYPSGHTGFAAALLAGTVLALGVCGRPTRPAWAVGVPVVLLVGLTRLYLGVHHLGDVVGAVLVVAGTTLLIAGGSGARRPRTTSDRRSGDRPARREDPPCPGLPWGV